MLTALALASVAALQGANSRYELGVRLHAFDQSLAQCVDVEKRRAAMTHVEEAVRDFFGGDVAGAAGALDAARGELVGKRVPWAESLALFPERRLCDAGQSKLVLAFARLYACADERNTIVTANADGDSRERIAEQGTGAATGGRWLDLTGLHEGDHVIHVHFFDGDFDAFDRTFTLSLVAHRDARLDALERAIAMLPEKAPAVARESAKENLELLRKLARSSDVETDYPAARILRDTEALVAAAAKGERWFGAAHAGEHWLVLPGVKSPTHVRMFVPEGLDAAKPVPLVIALHGAGGSENMFFDAYGAGAIVALCRERGWLLAAPRLAPLGGFDAARVVDELAALYPVDRARLLLVGHSLGASAGLGAVQEAPQLFRAFAVLGGGGGPKDAHRLTELPLFIGAGDHDLGQAGARKLHEALVAAGGQRASLHIFPDTEHLTVVQAALPDVFRFFDESLRDSAGATAK